MHSFLLERTLENFHLLPSRENFQNANLAPPPPRDVAVSGLAKIGAGLQTDAWVRPSEEKQPRRVHETRAGQLVQRHHELLAEGAPIGNLRGVAGVERRVHLLVDGCLQRVEVHHQW